MKEIKTEHYENGNVKSETSFVNDKKHSVAKGYYENGNLRHEIPFVNGKRHGVAKGYYENGNLRHEINYIVYGTLIKKLFMQNTDKKFLDIGSGLIPLKSDFSKQSDDKLVWILAYIKVLLVAEMQEEDEEEL